MSQYSETIGSFIRRGNYPLEADLIFESLSQLQLWAEENKTILHKGLFKIVDSSENQDLYWVIEQKGNLIFKKLLSGGNIEEIYQQLELLQNAIDNLEDIDIDEQNRIEYLESALKEIVGSETIIPDYLENLTYKNLTELSEELDRFLNAIDNEADSIQTFPQLQEFLKGYNCKHSLFQVLEDLYNKIEGTPFPSIQFSTLRGIQNFVEVLASVTKNREDNLQSELNQTQIGVGLSGDGSFNSDQETNYLKNATSVMNALKTLDSLIKKALNYENLTKEDSNTISIDIIKGEEKTIISADVKLAQNSENDILSKEDGLYHHIDSEYENGILTIKVNGNIRQQHVLGLSSLVDSAYYDKEQEAIIIVFKLHNGETQTVIIPAADLILEWIIDNSNSNKVIELEKERVINGPDKLSADIRLSANKDNILIKDGNSLLVKGTADNIKIGDKTVKEVLDDQSNKLSDLESEISLNKDSILDLAESIYYYHASATITANKTLIEKGVDTQITLTAKSSFRDTSADTLNIKNTTAGINLETTGTTATKTATVTISDTTAFQAIAEFKYNVNKTANVTVTAKYPIYTFGSTEGTITSDIITSGTKSVKSSASGIYSITLPENSTYFWICVPSDMIVNKVTLSGFDVTMEAPITIAVTGKGNYKCYRSANTNDSGTYTLVVS